MKERIKQIFELAKNGSIYSINGTPPESITFSYNNDVDLADDVLRLLTSGFTCACKPGELIVSL